MNLQKLFDGAIQRNLPDDLKTPILSQFEVVFDDKWARDEFIGYASSLGMLWPRSISNPSVQCDEPSENEWRLKFKTKIKPDNIMKHLAGFRDAFSRFGFALNYTANFSVIDPIEMRYKP